MLDQITADLQRDLSACEAERDRLRERLKLNQQRLEDAIRTWPGYGDFAGTPESAVGVAAEMVEGSRRKATR